MIFCIDWLRVMGYYFKTLKCSEKVFEICIPIIIGLITSTTYYCIDSVLFALLKLRDLLPATLAILIGFTINCITILSSSDSKNIRELKNKETDGRDINGRIISLYQWILTIFSYELIIQVVLLLFIFFVAFILRIYNNSIFIAILLFIEVSIILHIMFLLLRCISYIYFAFFPDKSNNEHSQ